jgi:hypothetical protein
MHCYGCSLFPVCAELPPSGFFEYRTQNWFLGVGPNGIVVMDFEIQKYVHVMKWNEVTWTTGPDQLYFHAERNGKHKEYKLITPQHKLVENLCLKLKYKWAKETGLLKSKPKAKGQLESVVVHKAEQTKEKQKASSMNNLKKSQGSLENLKSKATVLKTSVDKLAKKIVHGSRDKLSQEMIDNVKKSQNSIVSEEKLREIIPETILPKDYQNPNSVPNSPHQNSRKSRIIVKDSAKNGAVSTISATVSPVNNDSPQPTKTTPTNQEQASTPTSASSTSSQSKLMTQNGFQNSPRAVKKLSANRNLKRGQTEDEKALLQQLESVNPTQPSSPFAQKAKLKPVVEIKSPSNPTQDIGSNLTESPTSVSIPEPPKLQHSQSLVTADDRKHVTGHSHAHSASETQTHERTGSLGTYVKPVRQSSQVKQQGIQVNKRATVLYGFDDHLGGIGPTKLIDKRASKIQ